MVSDLGLTGSNKKSGYYLDGVRQKERFDNNDLVDQLEQRIRAKARIMEASLDPINKINIKSI
jgi:(E)-4-hydroxy-3-methylbut-2-enyl-diphosphate synthase